MKKTMEERKSVIMTDESDISIIDGVTEKGSFLYSWADCCKWRPNWGCHYFFKRSDYKRNRAQGGQYCCQFLSETNGTVKVYGFRSSNLS